MLPSGPLVMMSVVGGADSNGTPVGAIEVYDPSVGTDNAYVDFSHLKGNAVQVSDDRQSATITVGHAQLEPATLDVHESHVYAQQQGLFTRINEFLSGNPNSQQALYELAQKQIQAAAAKSSLIADAERNTRTMLTGLLQSLGFKNITVKYADSNPG